MVNSDAPRVTVYSNSTNPEGTNARVGSHREPTVVDRGSPPTHLGRMKSIEQLSTKQGYRREGEPTQVNLARSLL